MTGHLWHTCLLSLALSGEALSWGGAGHRFVNDRAVMHLPASMATLSAQAPWLASHASDADRRKSTDTSEAPKHYLDLELYADYQNLPSDLGLLVAQYGWPTVKANGILPWAIAWAVDSMTAQLGRQDWPAAWQTAADMGHYVADACQPLHCTANYDGAQTGNNGIHYRYESAMIDLYASSLTVSRDSVRYVEDPFGLARDCILRSNSCVDSILHADDAAKAASGWNGSGTPPASYYTTLWDETQTMTLRQFQEATVLLASLWYTAWVNAGVTVAGEDVRDVPETLSLEQNFPNPFNPTTLIRWHTGRRGWVRVSVYDLLGRELAVLTDGVSEPGSHSVSFDGSAFSSGVYLYRVTAGEVSSVKRMVLLR